MPLNFVPITIACLFKPKFVPHRATIRAIFTDFYVVFLAKREQFGSSGRLSDFHLRIRSPKRSFIKPISAKIRVFLLQKAPKIQIMQKTGVIVGLFSCFLPPISVQKWFEWILEIKLHTIWVSSWISMSSDMRKSGFKTQDFSGFFCLLFKSQNGRC